MVAEHWTVRVTTGADAASVTRLLQAAYPGPMASAYDAARLRAALPLMTRANRALLESGSYHVAEAGDGLLVGCGGWTPERPGTNEVRAGLAHVRHFGTHPAWTGRGIGRAIFGACETAARSAGIGTFECYASLNAVDFYAALGFEIVRGIELRLGADTVLPAMLMRRRIRARRNGPG